VNREDTWACLTLESLSTLRVVDQEPGRHATDQGQGDRRGGIKKPEREVPGWRLALPLFDRLLAMVAFYGRMPPSRIRVTRAPGFDYARSGSTPMTLCDAADIDCFTASVLFGGLNRRHRTGGPTETALMEQVTDMETAESLYDERFPETRCQPPGESSLTGIPDVFPLNRQWWSLAHATYRSELGSTCGCHGGNGHPCLSVGSHLILR
jgi:hypothetical protein